MILSNRKLQSDHVFRIGKCCKLISTIFAKMATFYIFMTRSESDVLVGPCALFIFRTKALREVENVVLGIHTPLLKFISYFCITLFATNLPYCT